ncbi:hypothetical protein CCR75_000364 [Bremia lactucae]|uniref:Uncharacterized protein n=1 Tax=Bremia lactucae TaxID=4779 RepID=A0A976IG35_BRELC|nr:hypothetical protein CCR75_000364 [Bremia lactucae]
MERSIAELPTDSDVPPLVLKPEPILVPRQNISLPGQVIDLTLEDDSHDDDDDDDDEDDDDDGIDDNNEDESMGFDKRVDEHVMSAIVSSPASDDAKQIHLGDARNESTVAVQSPLEMSAMMLPMGGDAESDVDEDWPTVSLLSSSSMPASMAASDPQLTLVAQSLVGNISCSSQLQKAFEVDDNCKQNFTLQGNEGNEPAQVQGSSNQKTQELSKDHTSQIDANTSTNLLNQDSTMLASCTDSNAQIENLEDGEIFEEGLVLKPAMQTLVPHQVENCLFETNTLHPQQRSKKPKKRGKKRNKRKLEAMQMSRASTGNSLPFERRARQRSFGDLPRSVQFSHAPMRNTYRETSMTVPRTFHDLRSAPLPIASGLHPPPILLPRHEHSSLAPPQLSYEDSQILRVNRQGSMEIFYGNGEQSLQTTFSEPVMQGGFQYRSLPMSPSRSTLDEFNYLSHRSLCEPPPPPRAVYLNQITCSEPILKEKSSSTEVINLDDLRAAALRSKVDRSLPLLASTTATKIQDSPISTAAPIGATSSLTSSSSPSRSLHMDEKIVQDASPNSENELRLEILRSMTRYRKQTITDTKDGSQVLASPLSVTNIAKKLKDAKEARDSVGNDITKNPVHLSNSCAPQKVLELTPSNGHESANAGHVVNCESSKFILKNGKSDKVSTSASNSANLFAQGTKTSPKLRPLTASTQSVVIWLNTEDFSPRQGKTDAHLQSTRLQEEINEMRRKIAEREQERINRSLKNTPAKWSGDLSSRAPSSPTSLHHSSLGKQVSTVSIKPPNASAILPEVRSSAIVVAEKLPTGTLAKENEVESVLDGIHVQVSLNDGNQSTGLGNKSQPLEKQGAKPIDTLGVSTFVDLHILPLTFQSQVPAKR